MSVVFMNSNLYKSCYIIAEIGLNHNGNYELAKKSVIAAAKSGANAVKFQNFETEDFLSDKSILHTYKNNNKEITESLFDICKRSEFKKEWLPRLFKLCNELKVDFLSTPTSETGVNDLINFGVKYIKNGSDYLSNIPLIKYMASTTATIIISTGMSYKNEIDDAVNAILSVRPDKKKLIIMHCTSSYPTDAQNTNLRKIQALEERYNTSIGFSDHTEGWISAVQAVTLGVKMIEKHFTLDKNLPGPDHWFSSNPKEFKELVDQIRLAECRMGFKDLKPAKSEMEVINKRRLGIVWNKDMRSGSYIKQSDVVIRKPAFGLKPKELEVIVGCKVLRNCKIGDPVLDADIENNE